MNMNLTEHTGHGIPTILTKYGEEAFDIRETYILVTIPYDSSIAEKISDNKNVGLNVGLNSTEKETLKILLEKPDETADNIAASVGVTRRTIERTLKKLQDKGFIVRNGSKKAGKWIVIK